MRGPAGHFRGALAIAFIALFLPRLAHADELGRTPRAAMQEFLTACRRGDLAAAALYLDLRHVPSAERQIAGPEIARRLKTVLDRTLWVDLESLSDDPAGDPADGLAPNVDSVGDVRSADLTVELDLVRATAPSPDRPAWRISSGSLTKLEPLLDAVPTVERWLPPVLTRTRVLEVALWQWLALPALAALALAGGSLAVRVLRRPVLALLRVAALREESSLLERTTSPARLVAASVLFLALLPTLGLSVPAQATVSRATLVVLAAAVVWLVSRWADAASHGMVAHATAAGRADAAALIPPAAKVLKLVFGAVVGLVVAQNFGLNVTGLLAGLGVGGLAVALAAQKTVENLFGGVSLVADRPVQVGDFCRFGDRLGTIEAIGLRSTRVRTLDRTVVTIPNSEFSALQLENYSERDRIWLRLVLGLRYETSADQLRRVLERLRQLLRDHPRVADPARVRFIDCGAYSLDLEIFAYVRTSDYDEYLAVREEILLAIMDLVAAHGTGFAFPSQTIYQARDSGIDPVRARAAEDEVTRARANAVRAGERESGSIPAKPSA